MPEILRGVARPCHCFAWFPIFRACSWKGNLVPYTINATRGISAGVDASVQAPQEKRETRNGMTHIRQVGRAFRHELDLPSIPSRARSSLDTARKNSGMVVLDGQLARAVSDST